MKNLLLKFWLEEDGPTAVEYAIMLALIIGVCVAAITLVGTETNTFYQDTSVKIQNINTVSTP